ncbi:hypothetical protein ACSL103130_08675 [Actinomyces slackii]|uniref:Uncharacterized protein n=1 Tax=Actinomyces slackii TaxID=52774 RepID=A0A448KBU5_9ACTO|nr:hypothetical protein [Actinomyces slackii]VEG74360.1 Uncharacterised protein [Actinomyces slackii]
MLLVHIAGLADLGIPGRQEGAERASIERCRELADCQEPNEARRRIIDLDYDAPAPGEPSGGMRSPLDQEIAALVNRGAQAQAAHTGAATAPAEPLEIIIVGVKGDRTPTEQLAQALTTALRIAVKDGGLLAGRPVRIHDACLLPGLEEASSLEELESVVGSHHGHVLLPLGGGAMAVVLAAAAVTTATHPDNWSLILLDRQARSGAEERWDPPVLDMSVPADPLRGWLLGLGLPTVLDSLQGTGAPKPTDDHDSDVRSAADSIRRALGGGGSELEATSDDIAALLITDVARGDLAAGMALRAWMTAVYLELHKATEGHTDQSKNGSRSPGQTLGRIQRLERSLQEPDKWMLARQHLVELGNNATHDADSPTRDDRALPLVAEVRRELGDRIPDWLNWPGSEICLLLAQGKERAGEGHPRRPLVVNLLSRPPARELRDSCAVPGPLALKALIAHSTQTHQAAQKVQETVKRTREDRPSRSAVDQGWGHAEVSLREYASMTAPELSSAQIDEAMTGLRHQARTWLSQQSPRPRAVVVATTGEKAAAIALLQAAQAFGADHGVPVLLMSSITKGQGREQFQFHQFGLDRDVRAALLKAAMHCLDRFDLLTAQRLLALGDSDMKRFAACSGILAEELLAAVRSSPQTRDAHAPTVLAVLGAIAGLIDSGELQDDAQIRLATIAGELLHIPPKPERTPVILAMSDYGDIPQGVNLREAPAGALLRLLYRIRNKTPINHGSQGLEEATAHELGPQGRRAHPELTYPQLLRQAVRAVRRDHPWTGSSDWDERMTRVRHGIHALLAHHCGSGNRDQEPTAALLPGDALGEPQTLINLTPHEVVLDCGVGEPLRLPSAGQSPRLLLDQGQQGILAVRDPQDDERAREVPLSIGRRVQGIDPPLPDPRPGTLYITGRVVAEHHPQRSDLVWPADLIRDSTGQVTAARGLATLAPGRGLIARVGRSGP